MWGRLISNRITRISSVMLSVLVIGSLSAAPATDAAPPDKKHRGTLEVVGKGPIAFKRIKPGQYVYPSLVPYIAYDYPYYYSRGFYPKHIGPGYIYKLHSASKKHSPEKKRHKLGSRADLDRCSRRFRSFERKTGLYTTYGGEKKRCPYLR